MIETPLLVRIHPVAVLCVSICMKGLSTVQTRLNRSNCYPDRHELNETVRDCNGVERGNRG